MTSQKRGFDPFSDEERSTLIKQIQTYLQDEHDTELGLIATEDLLNFMLQVLGKDLFNNGVEKTKVLLHERMESLAIDIDLLKAQ